MLLWNYDDYEITVHTAVSNHLYRGVANSSSFLTDGIYQGNPLSVVIFLTEYFVIQLRLPWVHPSLYACVFSSTPAGCQYLLDMVQQWLGWVQLKAKVQKCYSVAIQAFTRKMVSLILRSHDTKPCLAQYGTVQHS